MGIQIVQPSSNPIPAPPPGTSPTAFPGSTATQSPAPAAIDPALKISSPNATEPLPPVEKAAPAPDAVNEIAPGAVQQPAQAAGANGKSTKAPCDTKDESCSNHKKKKGLAKLNPF
jgi:outer membrane protein assembly factor BamD